MVGPGLEGHPGPRAPGRLFFLLPQRRDPHQRHPGPLHADLLAPGPPAERRSGFLAPNIRYASRLGLSYEQPYLWAISPSADLVVSPMITTAVAPFLNLTYRQRFYSAPCTPGSAIHLREALRRPGQVRRSDLAQLHPGRRPVPDRRQVARGFAPSGVRPDPVQPLPHQRRLSPARPLHRPTPSGC